MNRKNIIVDIDGTIINWDGTPIMGAVNAINSLAAKGYNIIIYTCRNNDSLNYTNATKHAGLKMLAADLMKVGFKDFTIDSGDTGKPSGVYYIDDRAIKFDSWKKFFGKDRYFTRLTMGVDISCILDKDNRFVTGAVKALDYLWKANANVIITGVNGNLPEVKKILADSKVLYDKLDTGKTGKPICDCYLELNAIRFEGSWEEVLKKIKD